MYCSAWPVSVGFMLCTPEILRIMRGDEAIDVLTGLAATFLWERNALTGPDRSALIKVCLENAILNIHCQRQLADGAFVRTPNCCSD